jgi:hypothetical protein
MSSTLHPSKICSSNRHHALPQPVRIGKEKCQVRKVPTIVLLDTAFLSWTSINLSFWCVLARPNALKSKNPFAWPKRISEREPKSADKIIRPGDARITDIIIPYVPIGQVLISPSIYCYLQDYGSYRRREKHRRQPSTMLFLLTKMSCVQFINTLLGTSTMAVGQGSVPCTATLQHAFISDIPNHPSLIGRRIVLLDTPGFDNDFATYHKRISSWLASS